MLWLCSILATTDEIEGIPLIAHTLDEIDGVLGGILPPEDGEHQFVIDGRLSSFERVPVEARDSVLSRLLELDLHELAITQEFAHALGMYPSAPGKWLLGPWLNRGLTIDWEKAHRFLSPVVVDSRDGRGRVATRAKAIVVGRHVKAGRMTFSKDMDFPFDLMHKYPFGLGEDEMQRIDGFSRASYMAVAGASESEVEGSLSEKWAKDFWRSNWRIYPCLSADAPVGSLDESESITEAQTRFVASIEGLHARFIEVATTIDPDLYEPDRYEVSTGIVSRGLRLAAALAHTPLAWSSEQGAPSIRSLVESLIVLRWLVKRDDPVLYSRFKDYGRGRLKLLKLHLEEYLDSLDDPPHELLEYHEYLDAEVNSEISEEFQNISVEATFSGVSAREMAKEIGMELEYRLQFAPASSATHGEWTSLDRYSLEHCQNPLHRGHRIPRRSLSMQIGAGLMETVLDLCDSLLESYINAVADGSMRSDDATAA